ncbi:hypothetical protein [Streptodolium elevatio]
MLHLTDTPTGRPQPAAPPGTRRLRVAYCPASLRAALAADLVRRAGERHHLLVAVFRHACDHPELPDPLRFNIHPPNGDGPDARVDVHITPDGHQRSGDRPAGASAGASEEQAADGPRILRTVPADAAAGTPEAEAWSAADPLALRLALLAGPSDAPPGADVIAEAAVRLALLRADVARFAESPSAALAAAPVAEVHAAVDDDLDTARALALTDALRADPDVPPGARFESLIHLDRTLGLDLAQDIGRLP